MASLNKCLLIGRLGKEPALNYTPNGQPVCKFSIATDDGWKDKDGKKHEKVTWHNIVIWGKLGETAKKYLKKGSLCYIEGKIDTRSYDDKETGQKKYVTEIIGSTIQFLDALPKKDPMDQRAPEENFNQDTVAADTINDHAATSADGDPW
jgi:single-strand DNA-binding protein